MAIKPTDNESFYREVDEELRRDVALRTWQRHGRWIIAGIVLVVLAVGGIIWWQGQRQARRAAQAETLLSVLDDMEKGAHRGTGGRISELEKNSAGGTRAAALFSRANLLIAEGDAAGSARVLGQIAADGDIPEAWRNAALVRQTALEFDRLQPAQIVQRLRPLVQRGNPYHGSAGELTAHALMRQQQDAAAARIFAGIARDDSVPESLRSRAVQMAGALGVDATEGAPANGGGQPAASPPPAPAAPAAPATKE